MKQTKMIFLFMFLVCDSCLYALPSRETKNERLILYGIKGPSGLGMIRLFEEVPALDGFDLEVQALAQPELLAARFLAGEAKLGILPPNVAAKIASGGKDLRIAAVTGMGMLSLLTSDPGIQSIVDLKGKTVEAAGQGATPDYVFQRILAEYGLKAGSDIRLSFSLAYPEIAQSLIVGRISAALLPEPFASMARTGKPDLRSVVDIQDEWRKITGTDNYPMTVLAVEGGFAARNARVLETILLCLEESIKWTTAYPAEAGKLAEKHELGFPSKAAEIAIPRSNYIFVRTAAARPSLESLFRLYLTFSPESIGGRLPEDRFYLP